MLRFARALPGIRRTAARHLARRGLTRERVLACSVRLLDRGFFRVGSEDYAELHGTYGLATMEKRHVSLAPNGLLVFERRPETAFCARRLPDVADRDELTTG